MVRDGVRVDVALGAMATERLEADVQTLAARLAAATCEWLLMIAEPDRREAWMVWECRSMAHWLSWKCAMSLRTGHEHVRIARELERLPLVTAAFAEGRLSYSKVRALTRLVTAPETEEGFIAALCHYHHRAVHQRGWAVHGDANGPLTFVSRTGRIADERTDRRRPLPHEALARAQAAQGFAPDSHTIATALGDRLDREWAINVLCHNDEVRLRRN
jgi:Domain of unknown function (DUF222)